MDAFARFEIGHHFVSDFETCQMDDADKFVAVFPDLALLKFQCHTALTEGLTVNYRRSPIGFRDSFPSL